MSYPYYDQYRFDSRHGAAIDYIRQSLRPMNEHGIYWTLTYGEYDQMVGARQLPVATLHKLIGIIHKMASTAQRDKHAEDRFIPNICSGKYRTATQRKAMVDSVYHFLPLIDEKSITVGLLHRMILGLPCNKKRIVNCSLPRRRDECAALLKFVMAGFETFTTHNFPRGISRLENGAITINSDKLAEIVTRHAHEVDRVIDIFYVQECSVEVLEERLNTYQALDSGVL